MKEMKEEGGKKSGQSERARVREFGERQNLGRGRKEKKKGMEMEEEMKEGEKG